MNGKSAHRLIAFVCLLALSIIFTGSTAFAKDEEFSLRGGIKFGMTPEEVISIEESNGFNYSKTSSDEILYNTGMDYNLNYKSDIGKLGSLDIFRFEYDFDLVNKHMYQFYYVFKGQNAFAYLSDALTDKYGLPDLSCNYSTALFDELGVIGGYNSHNRWSIKLNEELIVIDLWDNEYDTCFLTYQSYKVNSAVKDESSLDFGL